MKTGANLAELKQVRKVVITYIKHKLVMLDRLILSNYVIDQSVGSNFKDWGLAAGKNFTTQPIEPADLQMLKIHVNERAWLRLGHHILPLAPRPSPRDEWEGHLAMPAVEVMMALIRSRNVIVFRDISMGPVEIAIATLLIAKHSYN